MSGLMPYVDLCIANEEDAADVVRPAFASHNVRSLAATWQRLAALNRFATLSAYVADVPSGTRTVTFAARASPGQLPLRLTSRCGPPGDPRRAP